MATLFAIMAQCRSERASHFQSVLCVYLLACGATRSLFEVLNHAGISLSYTRALERLRELATENVAELRCLAREVMFAIVWDNINIAYRVGEQRHDSMDHFDNGTTATFIPIYGAERGSVPLSCLHTRSTRKNTFEPTQAFDYLPSGTAVQEMDRLAQYHVEDILLTAYPDLRKRSGFDSIEPPEVDMIPLHTTKQYPMPAAFIDESTINGTLGVINHLLFETLGLSDKDIEEHGVVFTHGDQLTISLIDSVSSAAICT
jgi:hypothetical protein